MIARWHEALDGQAEAFAQFDSPFGRAYLRGWVNSWWQDPQKVHPRTQGPISEPALTFYHRMMDALPDTLLGADTLYVEPDMMTVVERAAATFEPEPLLESDLPCPIGFLWLPRPFVILDRNNKRSSIRAFAWRKTIFSFAPEIPDAELNAGQGVSLYLLHRAEDHDDYDDGEIPGNTMLIVHLFPWVFGMRYPTAEEMGSEHGGLNEIAKPLVALWRLMQQPITMNIRERPPRAIRHRMPPPMTENLITVVKLRKPRKDPDPDHVTQAVDWSHRWLVGGHWRWQPYPSLGADVRRQIWISPYVKGPDDKPLIVRKARIFDLAR